MLIWYGALLVRSLKRRTETANLSRIGSAWPSIVRVSCFPFICLDQVDCAVFTRFFDSYWCVLSIVDVLPFAYRHMSVVSVSSRLPITGTATKRMECTLYP